MRQPWAWAIAMLDGNPDAKNVENRSAGFPSAYRGPLLVHAAKEAWAGQLDPASTSHAALLTLATRVPFEDLRSVVLAVVELADVHPDTGCCRPWGESAYTGADRAQHRGVVHLVLEDVRPLAEPIPCRGALGLWRPPAEVEMAVFEQLGATT